MCAVALITVVLAENAAGQVPDSSASCRAKDIRGRVSHGEAFEAPLSAGLVFRLEPEANPRNPPGWTIRITPALDPTADYAMVVTPPYRFWNPRYVDVSYGVSATETLAISRREFSFVASAEDYRSAREALGVLLWPASSTESAVDSAEHVLSGLRRYPATFWIEGGEAAPPDSTWAGGVIRWMSFRVHLCVPDEREGPGGGPGHG